MDSSKKSSDVDSGMVGWDSAIRDTETAIRLTKERLAGLRSALRVFKERKTSGEPFPGERTKRKKATK